MTYCQPSSAILVGSSPKPFPALASLHRETWSIRLALRERDWDTSGADPSRIADASLIHGGSTLQSCGGLLELVGESVV